MTSVLRPLLVEVPDVVLVDAVRSAKEYAPGAASHDSQENFLYRLLTVKYVYAKWAQLQDVAEKGEIIGFIGDSIKRLQRLQEWPDWYYPKLTNLDRRTREPAQHNYTGPLSNMTRGGNLQRDGRKLRVYYPNPERQTPDEAGRITATLANLGVKTAEGEEEQ